MCDGIRKQPDTITWDASYTAQQPMPLHVLSENGSLSHLMSNLHFIEWRKQSEHFSCIRSWGVSKINKSAVMLAKEDTVT